MTDGYPPSVREIGKAIGLSSTATVHAYLAKLEKPKLKKSNALTSSLLYNFIKENINPNTNETSIIVETREN